MKYRALALNLIKDGRPVQTYSAHLETCRIWANKITEAEHVPVLIYIYEERLIETVQPTDKLASEGGGRA